MNLTIIIPAYNAERYIEQCLRSICKSHVEKEIIVVDDGSSDFTRSIIIKMMHENNCIKYYYQKNSGVSKARNKGIELAKGKYIMFVDSDDFIADGYLERCCNSVCNMDFLCAGYSVYSADGMKEQKVLSSRDCIMSNTEFAPLIYNWMVPPYLLSPWSKMFRADIIKKYNIKFPEDMSYGEDVVFVLNYLRHAKTVVSCNNSGYCYRNTENSLSSNYKREMIDCDIVGLNILELYLKEQNVKNGEDILNKRMVDIYTLFFKRLINSSETLQDKINIFVKTSKQFLPRQSFDSLENLCISSKLVRFLLNVSHTFFGIDN